MLIKLLADLKDSPAVRARFEADAHAVMDEYGIPAAVRAGWRSHDLAALVAQLAREAEGLTQELKVARSTAITWPGPNVAEKGAVTPSHVYVNERVDLKVEVKLPGFVGSPPERFYRIEATFQCSEARIVVTVKRIELLPPNVSPPRSAEITIPVIFTHAGKYTLTLTIVQYGVQDSGVSLQWPLQIEVQA